LLKTEDRCLMIRTKTLQLEHPSNLPSPLPPDDRDEVRAQTVAAGSTCDSRVTASSGRELVSACVGATRA
jgi:hypothetical protein